MDVPFFKSVLRKTTNLWSFEQVIGGIGDIINNINGQYKKTRESKKWEFYSFKREQLRTLTFLLGSHFLMGGFYPPSNNKNDESMKNQSCLIHFSRISPFN
jgi:hypothetical protein